MGFKNMRKNLILISMLILALSTTLVACGKTKHDKVKEESEIGETSSVQNETVVMVETSMVAETVTNAAGEVVTNEAGETVTETVVVEYTIVAENNNSNDNSDNDNNGNNNSNNTGSAGTKPQPETIRPSSTTPSTPVIPTNNETFAPLPDIVDETPAAPTVSTPAKYYGNGTDYDFKTSYTCSHSNTAVLYNWHFTMINILDYVFECETCGQCIAYKTLDEAKVGYATEVESPSGRHYQHYSNLRDYGMDIWHGTYEESIDLNVSDVSYNDMRGDRNNSHYAYINPLITNKFYSGSRYNVFGSNTETIEKCLDCGDTHKIMNPQTYEDF